MSNPDPMNDPENERQDDDLLRDELDARRWWDEQDMKAEQINGDFGVRVASDPHNDDQGNSRQVCLGLNPQSGGEGDLESLHQFKHDEQWLAQMRWSRLYNEAWAAWADGKPFTWPPTEEQLRR